MFYEKRTSKITIYIIEERKQTLIATSYEIATRLSLSVMVTEAFSIAARRVYTDIIVGISMVTSKDSFIATIAVLPHCDTLLWPAR